MALLCIEMNLALSGEIIYNHFYLLSNPIDFYYYSYCKIIENAVGKNVCFMCTSEESLEIMVTQISWYSWVPTPPFTNLHPQILNKIIVLTEFENQRIGSTKVRYCI